MKTLTEYQLKVEAKLEWNKKDKSFDDIIMLIIEV